jgi:hypothetical protein
MRDVIPVNNLSITFMDRSVAIHNKEENIFRYILKRRITLRTFSKRHVGTNNMNGFLRKRFYTVKDMAMRETRIFH